MAEVLSVSIALFLAYCDFKIGAAFIVMHKEENKKYVAKKVILEGLGSKEQASCMMEAGLLKNLDHPNIVAYKESFLGQNSLIIIMEYCDGKHISLTFCNILTFHSFFVSSWRLGIPYQEKAIARRPFY